MAHILVTGGTGTVGSALVDKLFNHDVPFKVMVRNPQKREALQSRGINAVYGDFDDPDSFAIASQGIERLLLLTPPSDQQLEWQRMAVHAAQKNEIKQIVKVSVLGTKTGSDIHLADWHGQAEDLIRRSGIAWTFLHPHSFMQNFLGIAPMIRDQHAIYSNMKDGKLSMVDARDVADVAFEVLTGGGHDGKAYPITGPEAISYHDVAEAFSNALGQQVNYVDIPDEAARSGMLQVGLPEWLADDLVKLNNLFGAGLTAEVSPVVQELTGNPGRTIKDFVQDYADWFR